MKFATLLLISLALAMLSSFVRSESGELFEIDNFEEDEMLVVDMDEGEEDRRLDSPSLTQKLRSEPRYQKAVSEIDLEAYQGVLCIGLTLFHCAYNSYHY